MRGESEPYRRDEVGDTGWRSAGDGRTVDVRLRSELHQVGAGPTASWRALPWLELRAEADVLVNFAHTEFEADGARDCGTDTLLGFGGYAGLGLKLTDCCGLYGQVGYEWVDRQEVAVGEFHGRWTTGRWWSARAGG